MSSCYTFDGGGAEALDLAACDIHTHLAQFGLRHLFIGGYAMRCHLAGRCDRRTTDVDVMVDPAGGGEDYIAFVLSVSPLFTIKLRAQAYFCLTHVPTLTKVEILVTPPQRMPSDGVLVPAPSTHAPLPMLSCEQLLVEKLLTCGDRRKDADIADVALLLHFFAPWLSRCTAYIQSRLRVEDVHRVLAFYPHQGALLKQAGIGVPVPALVPYWA